MIRSKVLPSSKSSVRVPGCLCCSSTESTDTAPGSRAVGRRSRVVELEDTAINVAQCHNGQQRGAQHPLVPVVSSASLSPMYAEVALGVVR